MSLPAAGAPAWLTSLLALACGLIVANIYYAQPLIGPIAAELGLSPGAAGLIVTMTQIGYGAGLLLVVPVADLLENRRLALAVMGLGALGLAGAAMAGQPAAFLAASLVIGLGSVSVQILVPYAAHLAPERKRGQVVGNVMSGLLLGIMLARPVASLVADWLSWRAVFALSAGLMLALGLVLRLAMPPRHPGSRARRRGCATARCCARWAGWRSAARRCAAAPSTRPRCSPPSACSGRWCRCCWRGRSTASRNRASRCSRWPGWRGRWRRRSRGGWRTEAGCARPRGWPCWRSRSPSR
ncbi:MFS transporter [Teichococcus aestuarii]|uniref:MFS transporter n=1 Tax=Teichococcus aestuarii TaxID=568898 RepID=UPI003618A1A7